MIHSFFTLFFAIIPLIESRSLRNYHQNEDNFQLNSKPIIAVLAQNATAFPGYSYIAASYVKYLESAGARVVPIPESFSEEKVKEIYKHINGVLYPGGSTNWFHSSYYRNAKLAFETSIKSMDEKTDYFPVWGTCLGYETLNVIASGTNRVLTHFDADDISVPLNFTNEADKSRMFQYCPKHLYKALSKLGLTYNHHKFGISPETHKKTKAIDEFFDILSTSIDTNGVEFVSSIEAKRYPIYGTQWHPEKNNFEFNPALHAAHSRTAIDVSLYTANFFVDEARKSNRRFPTREMEENLMIYKYNPIHTGIGESRLKLFEQIYLFKN